MSLINILVTLPQQYNQFSIKKSRPNIPFFLNYTSIMELYRQGYGYILKGCQKVKYKDTFLLNFILSFNTSLPNCQLLFNFGYIFNILLRFLFIYYSFYYTFLVFY